MLGLLRIWLAFPPLTLSSSIQVILDEPNRLSALALSHPSLFYSGILHVPLSVLSFDLNIKRPIKFLVFTST